LVQDLSAQAEVPAIHAEEKEPFTTKEINVNHAKVKSTFKRRELKKFQLNRELLTIITLSLLVKVMSLQEPWLVISLFNSLLKSTQNSLERELICISKRKFLFMKL